MTAKLTLEDFILKANKIHNNKYDYSLAEYNGSHKKVRIICKKHGDFLQKANTHLNGCGCPKCKKDLFLNNNPKIKTEEKFIKQANKIHNNLYDYSKTFYTRDVDYVIIICKKHGEFKQIANYHVNGCGCPKCNYSKGELQIIKFLEKFKIDYEYQKKFKECKDINKLPFDFYLPKYNVCIEFDGEQHYIPIKIFGGIKRFDILKKHDKIKTDYCNKENVELIRISYRDNINEKLKNKLLVKINIIL
jgi:very-short-patch-repair endonuclease